MEQFLKGLSMDPDPSKSPAGSMSFAKNGVVKAGAVQSEPGFTDLAIPTGYPIIGKIEAGDATIIISADGTNTEIGVFERGVYTVVVDDATPGFPFKIKLDPAEYVTGQAQYNYNGELVAALTNRTLPPLFINCTNFGTPQKLADLYLQPVAAIPSMTLSVEQGGSLAPGAYFASIALVKDDGTISQWLTLAGPAVVQDPLSTSNSAVRIKATGIDSSYQRANIAIIHKDINGQLTVNGIEDVQVSNNTCTIVYTGTNGNVVYTIEEVLTLPLFYDKVRTVGQQSDMLYLGGPSITEPPILQKYAGLITVKWKSVQATPGQRTFMHEEVVVPYIRYIRANGSRTKAYIIPGPDFGTGDDTTDAQATTAGLTGENAKRYRTNPIPSQFDVPTKTGTTCAWYNETELYPNNDYFNFNIVPASARDLRGQRVRHHRMPSIRWCKQNLYPADPNYGKTWLDRLELTFDNVILPQGTDIVGYEILYAKRQPGDALVQGQSLMIHDAAWTGEPNYNFMSTGGNWNSNILYANPSNERPLNIKLDKVRFYPFDLLFNTIQPGATLISNQLKFTHNSIRTQSIMEDGAIGSGTSNGPVAMLIDHIAQTVGVSAMVDAERTRKVTNSRLVLNHTIFPPWKNLQLGTAVVAELGTAMANPSPGIMEIQSSDPYAGVGGFPASEISYLSNIIQLKADVFAPFQNQILVYGGMALIGAPLTVSAGDAFVSEYTCNTYGLHSAVGFGWGGDFSGIRVIRRYLCETVSDLAKRYEIPGNVYSKFYPKSPLVYNDTSNYFLLFQWSQDPNQFGYSNTYNSLPDLIQSTIFANDTNPVTEFPYRIHRTGKLSRQNKFRSWRTIYPLDYYEMPRTFGEIVRITGYGDKLLINMRRALYATVGNVSLQMENLSVVLGSADIFRVDPVEAIPDATGTAGLQDELAAVLTPFGYAFYDADACQAYLYSDKLAGITNLMYWFFRSLPKLTYHNPYRGEGIHMGYDPEHKRILMTWRQELPTNLPILVPSQITTPQVGSQYVYKGLVLQYVGTVACEGGGGDPECTPPTITLLLSPNITDAQFGDGPVTVRQFTVKTGVDLVISNTEYTLSLDSTLAGVDTWNLIFQPQTNDDYASVVTITALNYCDMANDSFQHTVDVVPGIGGGGDGTPLQTYAGSTEGEACAAFVAQLGIIVYLNPGVTVLAAGVQVWANPQRTTYYMYSEYLHDGTQVWKVNLANGQITNDPPTTCPV